MECNVWEEKGLLYTSDELTDEEKMVFEKHMGECSFCADQYAFYTEAQENIFKAGNFEVAPPTRIDNLIINSCSRPRTSNVFSMNLFASFVKGGVIFTIALVLGLSVPVYFSKVQDESQVELSGLIDNNSAAVIENDSLMKDSTDGIKNNNTPSNIARNSSGGVIPVGLSSDE